MDSTVFDEVGRKAASSTSRRHVLRLLGAGAGGGLVAAAGLRETTAKPKRKRSDGETPFKGIAVTGVDEIGNEVFVGTLDIKKFVAANDEIVALGKLQGTIDGKNGKEKKVTRGVRLPVTAINGVPLAGGEAAARAITTQQVACDILDLTLGPLDLNLLGLRVQLNQIDLQITAIPGGGLLGDLLCAVANLLNPLGNLLRIVELLNDILDFFG